MSQEFLLYDHPAQMEPLLPGEHRLGPLLERSHDMIRLGERLATAQVSALLKRGLLETDSPYGRVRLGVPLHALRFYFPRLWPEAEADAL